MTEQPPTKKIKIDDKVFNDPIHGSIRLHPLLVKIIDTPQFQRLRNIKQLGGKYFVYPGASHNRFEHSIGVAHLAGKLVEKLKEQQVGQEEPHVIDSKVGQVEPHVIDSKDVLCVKIAGLCHDLGHGPFSHVWDNSIVPRMREDDEKEWKHEQGSVKMLRYLIVNLKDEFKKHELDETDEIFIEELINPNKTIDDEPWSHRGRGEDKSFLYEIVANKRNGIDVDKWDYFKRDCHYLGLTCIFDIDRAMQFVRVLKPKDQRRQICFRDKEARNIFQMFQTRELLHRQAYMHKTARVVEDMLAEAFKLADKSQRFEIPIGKVDESGIIVKRKISASTNEHDTVYDPDPEMYTHLTDHVFQMILGTAVPDVDKDSDLAKAKKLLVRIQQRKLYKYLGQVPVSSDTEKKTKEEIKKYYSTNPDGISWIKAEDLFIDSVMFDFGKKENNPFDFIMFYSKPSEGEEPRRIPLDEVSSFLPENFQETFLRVYYKDSEDIDSTQLQNLKSVFKTWAEQYKDKWAIEKLERTIEKLDKLKTSKSKVAKPDETPSKGEVSPPCSDSPPSGAARKLKYNN